MNSRMDEIQDCVKMNVRLTIDKKGKQVTFTDQLPSQAIANPRNQMASSNQTHIINYVHVEEEAVEMALAISSLRSGKDPIEEEEAPIIVEHDSDSEDEEEHTKAEHNPDTYKPLVPYPQSLNCPKAKSTKLTIIY